MHARTNLKAVRTPKRTHREWTQAEHEFLCDEYERLTCREIADALGRTVCAVYRRARILGIHKQEEDWTDEEVAIVLKDVHDARLGHRTLTARYQIRSRLGRAAS